MLTLPRQLSEALRFTPEQFEQLCAANPEAVLELGADGQLITMTPTGGDTGARNHYLNLALGLAAPACAVPLKLFDSSTGFRLPDGSVLSPDASAVRLERWQALSPDQRRGFPPLCPDLVVELVSPRDEGPRGAEALRRKMATYIANGARLAWLLFPEQRAAEIWQCGAVATPMAGCLRIEPALALEGGELLPGLRLDLTGVWEG